MAQAVTGRISLSVNMILILAGIIIVLWMGFDIDALTGNDEKGS
jgi:hypothetical protein